MNFKFDTGHLNLIVHLQTIFTADIFFKTFIQKNTGKETCKHSAYAVLQIKNR